MQTRSKSGIFKPKVYAASHLKSSKQSPNSPQIATEPTCVESALVSPMWKKAMDEEFSALIRNHTWDLVRYSPQYNIVGNKWVFKLKLNPKRGVERYKVRLVAKGFHETPDIYFKETFSLVVKAATIRMVLTMVVSRNWDIRQLDVNNAFLNGTLEEEVYLAQPEGYVDDSKPNHVCKLNRALYGLKQAPRGWFDNLRATLIQWGFQNSKSDTSLFIFNSNGKTIYLLVYVDDILLTGNDELLLNKLTSDMRRVFALKNLGHIHYFLGIEAYRDTTGLYGTLEEEVYMAQPEGYVDDSKPNHVCKLNRALYGLKQAPRGWFDNLRATLIQWGFQNSKSDTSLFIFNSNGKTIYLLVYVDDILLTGNDELLLNKLTSDMRRMFALKNLGHIHYFLGIEAYRDTTGLYLSQSKYVTDLLKKHGIWKT